MTGYEINGTIEMIRKDNNSDRFRIDVNPNGGNNLSITLDRKQFIPLINRVLEIDILKIYETAYKKYGNQPAFVVQDTMERLAYEIFSGQIHLRRSTGVLRHILDGRKVTLAVTD
jgi:hypothetical protein